MIFNSTFAYNEGSAILEQSMEFGDFVLLVLALFVLISGLLSILFILYGGLLLILSGGKEEKIKPAINTIRYAVVGIIITVVSIFVFPILGRLLGLDVEKYASPNAILKKIEEIGDKIFGTTGSSDNYYIEDRGNGSSDLPSDFSDL